MSNRKIFTLAAGLLFLAFPMYAQYRTGGYSDLHDSEIVKTFKSHITYLTSDNLEGRGMGTAGEKAAADYVRDVLESYGVDVLSGQEGDIFGISMPGNDTVTSRNVIGYVQGYDKRVNDRYIVIGARLDNIGVINVNVDGADMKQIYRGANGNASGLATMLELARMVNTNSILFRRSVIFVAFGASAQSFAGSWYFLNRSFKDVSNIDAMINLDMLGTGNEGFYAYTSSNPDMNMILSQVSSQLQPVQPEIVSEEPYASDHRTFYSKEIPSVFFTTGRYAEHNTVRDVPGIIDYDSMEKQLEYIYNFTRYISNVDNPPLFRQDQVELKKNSNRLYTFDECDRKPTFMGNPDLKMFLVKWVYQYLKYPKEALDNGIQGRVIVGFTIGKNGKVTDVEVIRGVDPALDAEAVKVVAASPDWKPGQVNGAKVNTAMSVAIDFRLQKKAKFGIKK